MLVCEQKTMSMESKNVGAGSRTWAEEVDADVSSIIELYCVLLK